MINSLTSLRGIFILFIFFHHTGVYAGGGSMAVAFFFVLSGFSMTLGYKDKLFHSDFNYKQYLTRRFIKFYPLHWITLLADIPLVLMSTLHWWLLPVFFINAALLQTIIPIQKVYFSYNAVSWFLADILFFTIFFPFVFKWIYNKSFKQKIVIGMSLLLIYGLFVLFIPIDMRHSILYISPFIRVSDFIFGIYLALFYFRLKNVGIIMNLANKRLLFLTLVGLFVVLLVAESCLLNLQQQLIAPLYWPLIAFLILCASLPCNGEVNNLESRILLRLGGASFVIFLVHRLVVRYTSKLLEFDNTFIFVAFCLVLTIVLSLLIEQYILNPINKWLTRRILPSMIARS